MNNQKKTEILEKFSNLLDNAFQVNDVVYCVDVDNLYKLPKDITYGELKRLSIIEKIDGVTLEVSCYRRHGNKHNIFPRYYFSQGENAGHGEIFPTVFNGAYNVKRDGKFIYSEAEELEKIKLVVQNEANKLQEYITELQPHQNTSGQLNNIISRKHIEKILSKYNNVQESFYNVYDYVMVAKNSMSYEKMGGAHNFQIEYRLMPILNSLKCQMIIEFNK